MSNYFKNCIGDSYTPVHFTKHESTHADRVREVMQEFAGTKAADVIAGLVHKLELSSQRHDRLLAEYDRLKKNTPY